MIYTTCRYAPMELFAGFGETVKRLDPVPVQFECSDACAHPNMCSYAKAIIEEVKGNNIQRLVLTDCCDAMRRVYDVLKEDEEMEFLYLLPLPHKHGDAEIHRFAKSLMQLVRDYEQKMHCAFDIEKALSAFETSEYHRPMEPYVRLTGAHGGVALLEEIERTFDGIRVINDTCTGQRHLSRSDVKKETFFEDYALTLLNQPQPCLRMFHSGMRYPDDIGNAVGEIVHTIKFCDYYGFEYMTDRAETHVPLLKIETDTTRLSSGQLKTRLEAFKEELGIEKRKVIRMKETGPVYVAGIDSGSASTDAVIMNENREIIARAIVPTGAGAANGAKLALDKALADAGLSEEDLTAMITTGYGRETLGVQSTSVTEITCHARGAVYLNPNTKTVIDIGGQDSKVIRIDEYGNVKNFIMNDKCAAGTGRFLEMQARTLGMTLEEMSRLGLEWKKDVTISSMCTVFAESEVVSLVAKNTEVADIIHGLNNAVAAKTVSLVHRLGSEKEYLMTGGVARNAGVVKCLEEKLGEKVIVSENSQYCGCIGAALIALDGLSEM